MDHKEQQRKIRITEKRYRTEKVMKQQEEVLNSRTGRRTTGDDVEQQAMIKTPYEKQKGKWKQKK